MKILILGDINSSHLIKWTKSFLSEGYEIGIYSLSMPESDWYKGQKGLFFFPNTKTTRLSFLSYIISILEVKNIIRQWKPDNLNVHYATSYGLLGALCFFKPFYINVYGSDVFDFPRKSFLHQKILSFNFSRADILFSTSEIMALEIKKYTVKKVEIIPFGIDTAIFSPKSKLNENDDLIIIGCIKSLELIYAIDIAIKTFAEFKKMKPELNIRLYIYGKGSMESELKELARELKIQEYVVFKGKIPYDSISQAHNEIDIFFNLSIHESFGVSVLEAMSCGKPVIVTNTGGLSEIVNETCGILVPVNDVHATAIALNKLVENKELRENFGNSGRLRVIMNYNWKDSIKKMSYFYNLSIK